MFYRLLLLELLELSLVVISPVVIIALSVSSIFPDVSQIEQVVRRPYIRVLDKEGNLLAAYGEFYAEPISLKALPTYLVEALIDTEDRRFFQHFGFDMGGILRAFIANLRTGYVQQGGSSITQQLAKNFFIAQGVFGAFDQSIQRKVYELVLSVILENRYTKEEILTFYLNRVYFGSGAFGVGAAASRFFDKDPRELNIYEAASLVGMIQAPTRYAGSEEQAQKRTLLIIENMYKQGHISQSDKDLALLLTTKTSKVKYNSISRYFADWVVQSMDELFFAQADDITIHTTLDPKWQEIAEKHSVEIMNTLGKQWQAESVALISCDKTGAIRAMVGGTDYNLSQFNSVTSALRQTGSLFKVLVYLAALESGYTPNSLISDTAVVFGDWKPKNFMYDSKGMISMIFAFAKSVNTATVRLGMEVGPKKIIELAQRIQMHSPLPENLSMSLGTGESTLLEMMIPLLTLSNQGNLVEPYGITLIENTKTKDVLYVLPPAQKNPVIASRVVNDMLDLLEATTEYGTGRRSKFGHPVGGKTGTSQNERDKWYAGFSNHAITGVRFSTNQLGMKFHLGKPLHVILWKKFMEDLHKKLDFPQLPLERATDRELLNKADYKDMMKNILQDNLEDKSSEGILLRRRKYNNNKNIISVSTEVLDMEEETVCNFQEEDEEKMDSDVRID